MKIIYTEKEYREESKKGNQIWYRAGDKWYNFNNFAEILEKIAKRLEEI